VLAAFIIRATLMTEAVSTSEKSVNFYQTTQHNHPEDSHLHTCYLENLKSQFPDSSLQIYTIMWLCIWHHPGLNLLPEASCPDRLFIVFISLSK
jgi:hypothetical protein